MKSRRRSRDAGFTLIETLLATALLLLILAMLAAVTAQWLPNWNRGFARAQRNEQLALSIERVVSDLSAVEFIETASDNRRPLFDGTTLSVTFIRTAIGPNQRRGLEVVRLAEVADDRGPVLVRATAPFVPLPAAGGGLGQLRFTDPVVLIRAPYRVQFFYAGADRQWLVSWQNAEKLPSAIRIAIRDGVTGQILNVSTAAKLHVNAQAHCVRDGGQGCPDSAQQVEPEQTAPPKEL
jgi:general secretion pathway protein J